MDRMSRTIQAATLAALTLLAAGCDDPSGRDQSRVSLRLTDAPGDLASATVEIREIYFQGAADGGAGDGRISLFEGSRTFDLLDLQNGVTEELADILVPSGTYSQLRLVVGEATITTLDGTSYSTSNGTLQCPSCAQTGLKVNLPGGSVSLESDAHILLIDFDVAQSFGRAAGQSGRWVMHPVLAATTLETSGVITGTVSLAQGVAFPTCGGTQVGLTHFVPTAVAGEVSITGFTAADGALRFPFVAPGTYTMGFDSEIDFDNGETLTFSATPSASSVTVSSGSTATVNYTIDSASCGPTPST
jgi:hypothetical protein